MKPARHFTPVEGAGYDRTAPPAGGTGIALLERQSSEPAVTPLSRDSREAPDAARLGNPSFVWRGGQERRLAIIERYASIVERRVLDLGCGVGEYVRAFERRGAVALGSDIDVPRLVEARQRGARRVVAAAGEAMPFRDGALDVVVLNEVIEHVRDDRATMREVARVLRPGGACIIFAPNRLFPFETHGVYLGRRYVFGNIPLVNWLPRALRDRLVPHARVYTQADLREVVRDSGLELRVTDYVFPGFDNIAARFGRAGRLVRSVMHAIEGGPLRRFGLSHVFVLRKPAELRSRVGGAS